MSKITVELNKKTLSEVYNQVAMCNDLGFPNFQKGEPINNWRLQESKKFTIAPAYNKGGYQVISKENIKNIGK